MKYFIFFVLLISSFNLFAETSLHAHEHGSISLEVGVEGKVAMFSIDGPSESFLGFESSPKTTKEKKVFSDAKSLWETKFFELVTFEKSLDCKLSEAKFEQVLEKGSSHSDVEAGIKVTCNQSLKGAKILVNLKKYFKNIKKLKLELVGNETKSILVNSDSYTLNL
jgi:hypothetical protein